MAHQRSRCLPKELVYVTCKHIPLVELESPKRDAASWPILLTSISIQAYLGERFQRKDIRKAVLFIKSKKECGGDEYHHQMLIRIGEVDGLGSHLGKELPAGHERAVFITTTKFCIIVEVLTHNHELKRQDNCSVYSRYTDAFDFISLIAPYIGPIQLNLGGDQPFGPAIDAMATLADCIESVHCPASHFLCKAMCQAMEKHSSLTIGWSNAHSGVEFRRFLLEWLTTNNDGSPKRLQIWPDFGQLPQLADFGQLLQLASLYGNLLLLVDEMKQQFSCATRAVPFILKYWGSENSDFRLTNEHTDEVLSSVTVLEGDDWFTLIRRSSKEDAGKHLNPGTSTKMRIDFYH